MTKSRKIGILSFQDRSAYLICLGIAMLFWIATKFGEQYDQEFTYEIDYQIPTELAFAEIPEKQIKPVFTGSGWEIFYQGLNKKKHVLPVNLPNQRTQRFSRGALIDRIDAQTSAQLDVKSLNVDFLDIRLEEKKTKKIPVVLKGNIQVGEQFVLKNPITIDPDSVDISGPISIIDSILSWDLPLLERGPITQSITEEAKLTPPDDALISVTPELISIITEVEALTDKSFYIPIEKDTTIPYRLFPDRVLVTFSIGLSKFHDITRDAFEVELLREGKDLEPGAVPIHLKKWPEIAQNVQFSPKSVDVLVVQDTVSLQ